MPKSHVIVFMLPLLSFVACNASAQDQQPGPLAAALFSDAFNAECQTLQQSNTTVNTCGSDTLFRNPSIPYSAYTSAQSPLVSTTRYNPAALISVQSSFGDTAVFFILAHELGHHFDYQFSAANLPWGQIVYPSMPGVPPVLSTSWTRELRADAWAGCAIKRTGGSIFPVAQLQTLTANIHNNPDVPPVQYVLIAVQAGYNAC